MFRTFATKQERVGKYSVEFALFDCGDNCQRSAERPATSAKPGRIDGGLVDDADFQD